MSAARGGAQLCRNGNVDQGRISLPRIICGTQKQKTFKFYFPTFGSQAPAVFNGVETPSAHIAFSNPDADFVATVPAETRWGRIGVPVGIHRVPQSRAPGQNRAAQQQRAVAQRAERPGPSQQIHRPKAAEQRHQPPSQSSQTDRCERPERTAKMGVLALGPALPHHDRPPRDVRVPPMRPQTIVVSSVTVGYTVSCQSDKKVSTSAPKTLSC